VSKLYVGIDAHSEVHKVALMPASLFEEPSLDLRQSKIVDIENTKKDYRYLSKIIGRYSGDPTQVIIGIDSCGFYSMPLTQYLQSQDYQVYYMDQKLRKITRNYLFGAESKNDTIDAIRIANGLYLKDVTGSLLGSAQLKTPDFSSRASILRTLVLHQHLYTKLTVQATNRLQGILSAVFPEAESSYSSTLLRILPYYPTPQEIARSHNIKRVKRISEENRKTIIALAKNTVGIPSQPYRSLILDLCYQRSHALNRKKEITKYIEKEVDEHPYGTILLSFPGFGHITAATMIGAIGDINRWASDKKLKKAFNLYTVFQNSGKSKKIQAKGKQGSRMEKAVLFQTVLRCIKQGAPENDFRDYYLHKVEKGKPKMSAIVATMGKLTEIMYHCLKTDESYSYQGIYRR
jgi:transposase